MGGFSKQASDKQSIKAADTACSNNAVCGRRRSEQASGKQSLSAVPPCRKQAVSIRPFPQASQNNSIRSLSLRDLAFLRAAFSRAVFRVRATFRGLYFSGEPLFRPSLFLDVCMYVCMSLRISIGLLLALRRFAFFAVAILGCVYVCRSIFQYDFCFFRGRYSWMCVCVSLHISI